MRRAGVGEIAESLEMTRTPTRAAASAFVESVGAQDSADEAPGGSTSRHLPIGGAAITHTPVPAEAGTAPVSAYILRAIKCFI
jgi:hypothetical protein